MQNKKILIVYIILIILIPTIIFPVNSQSENSTYWDKNWLYKQEIILPISTELSISKYQPIDIGINFNNNCWANNEKEHSIRVICKKDNNYYELESQIYDLEYKNVNILQKCGLIFLIPEFANGNEKYYVYYDNTKKTAPNYLDHVKIEDTYYYYEPISGISAEGDYYKIIEDDYIVFGIGQKGNVINRWLSQAVVKLKPKTEKFDIANSDNMASFAFSYHIGTEDEDEFSSDQKLVSKNIRIDGNLMIEFAIISESENKELRTTCIYRYYYCPTEDKKISAHVKHEIMAEGTVKGIENVDGRFGAILSYQSKSSRIPAMRFGEIKPYLHVYGEDGKIKEYYLDSNPENNKREWIISYSDDCDIGSGSWLSYDEGTKGKAQGIIFSSNEDIIRYGTDERDGIQIKLAEKEILDVLGAEIDYAAISFGRNSYEKGGKHDLKIPKGLLVEYDVEYYITEDGGYNKISEEAKIFKELIKHRKNNQGQYEADTNINTLRVIPRLSGRILTNPLLANITGWDIFKLTVELYQGEEFISKGEVYKPLFGAPRINFPKLAKGDYIVKIFKKIGKTDKKIIGLATVKLEQDETIDVICTWQKDYKISLRDQNNQNIKNANLEIFSNDEIQIESKISNEINKTIFSLPFNLFDPYVLRVFYKGFKIYDDKLSLLDGKIDIILPLYDLEIIVRDELNFPPNVNLKPILLATANDLDTEINAINLGKGKFLFENIPNSSYKLIISFGNYLDEKTITITDKDSFEDIRFSAVFQLSPEIYDSRGNLLENGNLKLDIFRGNTKIYEKISPNKKLSLPPAVYSIYVYSNNELIAKKIVDLKTDKNVKIVTIVQSRLPTLVYGLVIIFILEILVLFIIKKFSLNTFLKLIAMSLILVSLFLPWWSLNANSTNPVATKGSELYIIPQVMMESITYEGTTYLELATIPTLFSDFLIIILVIVIAGLILTGISFFPNIIYKKRFFKILILSSILFLVLVGLAFPFGMSKLTDLSLGSLNGEGIILVEIPNNNSINMQSYWGLSIGFYLCIISAIILFFTGFIDYLNKIGYLKKIKKLFFR